MSGDPLFTWAQGRGMVSIGTSQEVNRCPQGQLALACSREPAPVPLSVYHLIYSDFYVYLNAYTKQRVCVCACVCMLACIHMHVITYL